MSKCRITADVRLKHFQKPENMSEIFHVSFEVDRPKNPFERSGDPVTLNHIQTLELIAGHINEDRELLKSKLIEVFAYTPEQLEELTSNKVRFFISGKDLEVTNLVRHVEDDFLTD